MLREEFCVMLLCLAGMVLPGLAQEPQQNRPQGGAAAAEPIRPSDAIRPSYVLGPGDEVTIRAFEVEEIGDKPYRIDDEGDVNLPVLGKIHAGGRTVEQFEADLAQRLKTLVKNPQVTVSVVQYRREPVFVEGYFKNTGIYPLQNGRTLVELLTSIGGVQPNASRRIHVTRRLEMGTIPLPNAVVDSEKGVSTVEINIETLRQNLNPQENIILQPLDTVSVGRAESIYVNGEVNKVGTVELMDRQSIPVTQLLTMVGGLGKDAAPDKARILRQVLDSSQRAEIPINLTKILSGRDRDFPVLPNDILYVPRSSSKQVLGRLALIGIPMATAFVYVIVSKL